MKGAASIVGRIAGMCGLAVVLASCATRDQDRDLRDFVAQVKARPPSGIEPLPEIKQVETFVYVPGDRRDPFARPEGENVASEEVGDGGIAPDPHRRKEELESFPLDSLRMVGTLDKDSVLWGLVKNSAGMLYRVKPGNYMGRNHGQITRITETEISLTEIATNGRGGYLERQASLQAEQPSPHASRSIT